MATKKQKRALGEARAKVHAEQTRQSGLLAQAKDREARALRQKELADAAASAQQKSDTITKINGIPRRMPAPALD